MDHEKLKKEGKKFLDEAKKTLGQVVSEVKKELEEKKVVEKAKEYTRKGAQKAVITATKLATKLARGKAINTARGIRRWIRDKSGPAGEKGEYTQGQVMGSETGKVIGLYAEKGLNYLNKFLGKVAEKTSEMADPNAIKELEVMGGLIKTYVGTSGDFNGTREKDGVAYNISKTASLLSIKSENEAENRQLEVYCRAAKKKGNADVSVLLRDYELLTADLKKRIARSLDENLDEFQDKGVIEISTEARKKDLFRFLQRTYAYDIKRDKSSVAVNYRIDRKGKEGNNNLEIKFKMGGKK